jgi:hypothetical protein
MDSWISNYGDVGGIIEPCGPVAERISILGFVHDDEKFLAACVRAITTSSYIANWNHQTLFGGLLETVTQVSERIYIFYI